MLSTQEKGREIKEVRKDLGNLGIDKGDQQPQWCEEILSIHHIGEGFDETIR